MSPIEKVVRNLLIGADQTLNCVIWVKGDGFGSPDETLSARAWRKYRDAAGVKDLHIHDTRHEAASNLAKVLSNIELSKMLGHRDPRTTMIYYNPTPEELAKKLRGTA